MFFSWRTSCFIQGMQAPNKRGEALPNSELASPIRCYYGFLRRLLSNRDHYMLASFKVLVGRYLNVIDEFVAVPTVYALIELDMYLAVTRPEHLNVFTKFA
jgi:hypothetical protein